MLKCAGFCWSRTVKVSDKTNYICLYKLLRLDLPGLYCRTASSRHQRASKHSKARSLAILNVLQPFDAGLHHSLGLLQLLPSSVSNNAVLEAEKEGLFTLRKYYPYICWIIKRNKFSVLFLKNNSLILVVTNIHDKETNNK